jgi:hypothetical protein
MKIPNTSPGAKFRKYDITKIRIKDEIKFLYVRSQ